MRARPKKYFSQKKNTGDEKQKTKKKRQRSNSWGVKKRKLGVGFARLWRGMRGGGWEAYRGRVLLAWLNLSTRFRFRVQSVVSEVRGVILSIRV